MHGGGAWRRYLLPVFLTLLNSAPSVEYRLNFFFLSQKLTFIISFTSTSQCFSPLLTVLFVSTEHERVQAFYPFSDLSVSQVNNWCLRPILKPRNERSVCCWWWCFIVRSLTLGWLFERGEPSTVPRNPQCVGVSNDITVCVREGCVLCVCVCIVYAIVRVQKVCVCVYVVSPFNYTI